MMKADWDMTPVKGGSGNAFFGKSDQERVFIKKNGSPFLPSIYLEGITPKVLWTKRTAEGDTLSAQPWIDGHTLSPEDMEDRQINHILAHLHDSKKLVESYKKLGSQIILPEQLLEIVSKILRLYEQIIFCQESLKKCVNKFPKSKMKRS